MFSYPLELERCLPLLRCELCGADGRQFVQRIGGRKRIICSSCSVQFYEPPDNCHGRKSKFKRRNVTHLRKRLYAERGEFCENCHSDGAGVLHLHHVEGLSGGGPTSENNTVILCRACHRKAHRDGLGGKDGV